jgi:hypothetical protein
MAFSVLIVTKLKMAQWHYMGITCTESDPLNYEIWTVWVEVHLCH